MNKNKSRIPFILVSISVFLTILLIIFIISKSTSSTPIATTSQQPAPPFLNLRLAPSPIASVYTSPSPTTFIPKNGLKESTHYTSPNGNFAFYYYSDIPAFTNDEPGYSLDSLKIGINGDSLYWTKKSANQTFKNGYYPNKYGIYVVEPRIIDLSTKKSYQLFSLDKGPIEGNGVTKVIRWIDNTNLLVRSCGEAVGCNFDLINVRDDISVPYASNNIWSKWDKIGGFEIKSRRKNYSFIQSCNNENPCDIKIYRDLPIQSSNYFSFDLSGYSPINLVTTTKYLNQFEFDDENIATLNQRVKLYVSNSSPFAEEKSKDGYFIFDLTTGTVIEQNKL